MTRRLTSTPSMVLLDRDGVLNVQIAGDYVRTAAQLVLLPGAAAAVRRLNDAAIPAIVVTNQRGIARGLMTTDNLVSVHDRLRNALADSAGARLDGIYTCPHDVGVCGCRKPLPGLISAVAKDHPALNLAHAVLIGDSQTDIAAARAAGVGAVRVGLEPDPAADITAGSLAEAVEFLLTDRDSVGAPV